MCPSEISDWALDQLTSSTCDTSFDDIISLACLVMYKSLSLIHLSSSDPLHPTLSPPGPHSLRSRAFTSNQRALLPIRPSIPSAAARIGLPGGHFPVSRDAPAVSSSVISSILVDLGVAGDFNVLDETYDLLSNVTSVTSHSYGGYYGGHNMMRGRWCVPVRPPTVSKHKPTVWKNDVDTPEADAFMEDVMRLMKQEDLWPLNPCTAGGGLFHDLSHGHKSQHLALLVNHHQIQGQHPIKNSSTLVGVQPLE